MVYASLFVGFFLSLFPSFLFLLSLYDCFSLARAFSLCWQPHTITLPLSLFSTPHLSLFLRLLSLYAFTTLFLLPLFFTYCQASSFFLPLAFSLSIHVSLLLTLIRTQANTHTRINKKTREFQTQLLHYFSKSDEKSNHHQLHTRLSCNGKIPLQHTAKRIQWQLQYSPSETTKTMHLVQLPLHKLADKHRLATIKIKMACSKINMRVYMYVRVRIYTYTWIPTHTPHGYVHTYRF